MKKIALFAVAVLFASTPLWAAKGRIQSGKDVKTGDIVWQKASKKYKITYKQNKTQVSAEYGLGEFDSLDVEKPANLDAAIQSRNQAALEKITKDYLMLKWDRVAGKALVDILLKNDRNDEAFKVARELIKDDPKGAYLGEFAPAYWRTLQKTGETARLENCLRKAATDGDRLSSANALIMRGDILCDSETPDYRKALTDAYLRVALMYGDEDCKPARVVAVDRCKDCLTRLGMPSRAAAVEQAANIH
ncbi:MAG: hypothetical protein K6F50_05380 [Kiritimatiellae bacterium]|nr:hypothetical protein [Kiritimatiellia bacterium]